MNSPSYYQQNRTEILTLIGAAPRSVLDIGCGKGGVASMLRLNYATAQIVGFDKYRDDSFDYNAVFESFHSLDVSGEWPQIDYSGFDLVLLLDLLEHLIDPHAVLAKLSSLLTSGTQVIISLPNFHFYSNLYEIVRTGRFQYKDSGILDRTHLRFYGQEDARNLINPHFAIKTFMPHFFQPQSQLNKAVGIILGNKYAAYQNIFLCIAPGRAESLFSK